MTQNPAQLRFTEIASKWRTLVERRRDHLVELHMSGRWSTYFSEQDFKRSMQQAADAVEKWATVAPRLAHEPNPSAVSLGAPHRTAA
jgi:uncharacterized repeat protein (TIGR03809 family)